MNRLVLLGSVGAFLSCAWAPAIGLAQPEDETPWRRDDETPGFDPLLPEAPVEPPRVAIMLGGGTSVRLVRNEDELSQSFAAPGFFDAFGAYVLGTSSTLRHGIGAQLTIGLTGDGNSQTGVDGLFEIISGSAASPPVGPQVVLSPAYYLYWRLDPDLVLGAKALVSFNVTPSFSPGFEVAAHGAYFFTSGLGAYGEVGTSLWLGIENGVYPLVSIEAGLFIDYEVLP